MYALLVEPQLRRAAAYVAAAEALGLDPALARSEAEARSILERRGPPVVCVVELSGGQVDGFRFLRHLRDVAPGAPSVVVSAFAALRDTAWRQREQWGIEVVLTTELAPEAMKNALTVALRRTERPRRPPVVVREPDAEALRLARLHAAGLAESADRNDALDALLTTLPASFGVDAAVCTVLTADREIVVGHAGLRGRFVLERGTEREHSIARHVVEAVGGATLILEDAALHPTFGDNPLVREGAVRGFVGVPLLAADGTPLGALCLLHRQPLVLGEAPLAALTRLAQRVSGEIETLPGPPSEPESRVALSYFAALIQNLDQPVAAWSETGRLRLVNAALARATGLPTQAFLGLDRAGFAELLAPLVKDPTALDSVRTLPAGPAVAVVDLELHGEPPRTFRWTSKPLRLEDGVFGQLDLWRDVTAERELVRAAMTDSLTQLANRRGGEVATRRELARAARESTPLSFVLLDIDWFKRINDAHGHAVGDTVIKGVAAVLGRTLRASDVAARWGGEEFLVVLPDTDLEAGTLVAERVRARVEAEQLAPGVFCTVSAGVATLQPGESAEAAIGRADNRLYDAKEAGRNRVVAVPA